MQEFAIYLKQYSQYLKCKKNLKACCVALIEQKRNITILFKFINIYLIALILIIKLISKLSCSVNNKILHKKS